MSTSQTPASRDAQARRDAEKEARESLKSLIPDEYLNQDAQSQTSGKDSVSSRIMRAAESYIHALLKEKLDLADEQAGSPPKSPKGKGKEKEQEQEKTPDPPSKKRKTMAKEVDEDQEAGPSKKHKSMAEELDEDQEAGPGPGPSVPTPIPSRREDRTRADQRRHDEMIRGQATVTGLPSPFVSEIPEIQQLRQCARRLVGVAEGKADAAGEGAMSEELRASIEKGSDLMIDLIEVIEQEGWSKEMKEKWEVEKGVGREG